MPSPFNITSIPSSRANLIDPRTGLIAREWYLFFQNTFTLLGSGSNPIALDEVLIGPPRSEALTTQSDPVSSDRSTLESQVYEGEKQIQALAQESCGMPNASQAYEGEKQIQALLVTPDSSGLLSTLAVAQERIQALELVPPVPEFIDEFTDLSVEDLSVDNVTVNTGVASDGGGLKHDRVTTGSILAGTSALVTVAWTTAFTDANYTVVASVQDSTAATSALAVVHIETKTAAAVQVRVENTAAGDLTGTLHVIAMHDA